MKNKFSCSMGRQFAETAYQAGAVAPQWMVRTVDAQAERGGWLAGLTGGVLGCYQKNSFLCMNGASRITVLIRKKNQKGRTMKTRITRWAVLWRNFCSVCLLLALAACAGLPGQQGDYFPSGWLDRGGYGFGGAQSYESYENIEAAQVAYSLNSTSRSWGNAGPSKNPYANIIGLYAYYPLSFRWKLKDGREFVLENIDLRPIMREYFKTHEIKLPWQREGRPPAKVGDGGPSLAYEIKGDNVTIKWVMWINKTPVNERLTKTGAANPWEMTFEIHDVITLQGNPTQGINFSKWFEHKKQ